MGSHPAIPLLAIYPKDYIKTFCYKDTCTHMFIVALFTIVKMWNQPKCPSIIDWTRKTWHIYTTEYYTAIKNDEFVMDESKNHHSQQTDTRTENQTPHILSYRRMLNNENTWTQGGEHHTPAFLFLHILFTSVVSAFLKESPF